MANSKDLKYLNALNKISGVGAQRLRKLVSFFGSAETAWGADLELLIRSGIGENLAGRIFDERKNTDPDQEMEIMEKENIRLIEWSDPLYPALLKEALHPPYILYIKTSLPFDEVAFLELVGSPAIAIVGARKNTPYGAMAAQNLSKDLAAAGVTVISGMALGIDSWAHRGALDGNGKTIAVLGNSLDEKNIYPRHNINLAHEIMGSGALFGEYPTETAAGPLTFPARNRIVAGLTLGTVVIEAGEKSGALITAQMALESNREVFAVPGSIFSESSIGTNSLIRSGAKVVTGVKDILEELGLEKNGRQKISAPKVPTGKEEEILLRILSSEPLHIDNISKLAKLQTASVAATLSMMELKGWVKNIGGQNYILL
ncbi:MAG: DNA-processing protein DprA [Parcubacteria group bacterium]